MHLYNWADCQPIEVYPGEGWRQAELAGERAASPISGDDIAAAIVEPGEGVRHFAGSLKAVGGIFFHHSLTDGDQFLRHVGTLVEDAARLTGLMGHEPLRQCSFGER